jgi:hypothetical protein
VGESTLVAIRNKNETTLILDTAGSTDERNINLLQMTNTHPKAVVSSSQRSSCGRGDGVKITAPTPAGCVGHF